MVLLKENGYWKLERNEDEKFLDKLIERENSKARTKPDSNPKTMNLNQQNFFFFTTQFSPDKIPFSHSRSLAFTD